MQAKQERAQVLQMMKQQNQILCEIYEKVERAENKGRKDLEFLKELVELKEQFERYVSASTFISEEGKKELAFFMLRLERILQEKKGVQKFCTEGTEPFDSDRQQGVRSIVTEQEELDGKVAKRIGCGYTRYGEVIMKEAVEIYRTE